MINVRKAYIFDIDGTLANNYERASKFISDNKVIVDWDGFYEHCDEDLPISDVCALCRTLGERGFDIIYLTGRPERVRVKTAKWIFNQNLPIGKLYMRPDKDHREDYEFKNEIYNLIKDNYDIVGVFEDRKQCVDMWRRNGVTCYQVAEGNF